ncbi:MAG: tRNA (N(6)-L-threonylcarbamoyladenosine(37)-C(2))-methylthiotransferase MtaB [Candidatus Omnitrophota bacterium]|nr:MAG: tRNA (N(6)-L-threonylcarbamoyladenosine(37)-C(2))-methylthiotransferase MtaB [Candidatus Omnitrophota bacterium]
MTITFKTLGCKVNQYETQLMREQFASIGWEEKKEGGEIYIINTCSVTSNADRKSRQMINRAIALKPKPLVVITGCGVNNKFSGVENIQGVDLKITNQQKEHIVPLLKSLLKQRGLVKDLVDLSSSLPSRISSSAGHNRVFIKIQDGCDKHCSFCIIPYLRGRSRSRQLEDVLREIEEVVEKGAKEIVLCGVQLGNYGRDIGTSLARLIEKVERIRGLERFRLSSLNPEEIDEEIISLFRNSDKLCSHLHLSLQSGDNNLLRMMRRAYTQESFLSLLEKIRRKVDPLFSFSTDVMVGFPGEGEKEFLNTLKVIREAEFLRVHIFTYTPRKGTKAAEFLHKVNFLELKERRKRAERVAEEVSYRYRQRFLNRKVQVLTEGKRDKRGYLNGYTQHYIRVSFSGEDVLKNRIISVKINRLEGEKTLGEVDA